MTERTGAGAAGQAGDVLASGDDRPPWRPDRRATALAGVAVLVAAVLLAGVAVVRQDRAQAARAAQAAAAAEVLRLSIGNGQGMPRYGPRPPGGLHVQVRNDGPTPVRLVSAGLSPGGWRLALDGPTLLEPGASAVFGLSRGEACSGLAELRSSYRVLLVEAVLASGRRARTAVDLSGAQLAYGGELDDALTAPGLACLPLTPSPAATGPTPDPS